MEVDITATLGEIEIGASGVTEIIQNVKTILSTIRGTVPLDREFGIQGDFLDKPLPVARALYAADVVEEVEKQEPRVRVSRIWWEESGADAADGILKPSVRIRIKEGVVL